MISNILLILMIIGKGALFYFTFKLPSPIFKKIYLIVQGLTCVLDILIAHSLGAFIFDALFFGLYFIIAGGALKVFYLIGLVFNIIILVARLFA